MANETVTKCIQDIFDQTKTMYTDIKQNNIFNCVTKLMEIVEKIPILTGADKKEVVIGVLTLLINEIHFTDDAEKQLLLSLITNQTIANYVDEIVTLAKIGIKLNKGKIKAFFSKMCCCK